MKLPLALAALTLILALACDAAPTPTHQPLAPTTIARFSQPTPRPANTIAPLTPAAPKATAPATASAIPTATATAPAPLPTAAPTPASGRIQIPTPTPTPAGPTPTAAPPPTPIPTARPEATADDRNICRRTPQVQGALMQHLGIPLCSQVTIGELFRITGTGSANMRSPGSELDFPIILHPDDLAGLVNLTYFEYHGDVFDYLDFSHTPEIRRIVFDKEIEHLPASFTVANLPKLEYIYARFTGPAACELLDRETLRRVFGEVGNWPVHHNDGLRLTLWLPLSESPDGVRNDAHYEWQFDLANAIKAELGIPPSDPGESAYHSISIDTNSGYAPCP